MVMTIAIHSNMLQLRAKSMAQRYQTVHAAAERYVDVFRKSLSDVPADCARPLYQADSPLAPHALIAQGACSLKLDNSGRAAAVFNALQPTPEELQSLGLLASHANAALMLERDVRVFSPGTASSETRKAPERLAVLVRKVCETPGCTGPVVLESLTYNMQPFLLKGGNWLFGRLDQVRWLFSELGDGAVMSQDGSPNGVLEDASGGSTLDNPVTKADKQGLPGIVALRSTVNGSMDALWARRDGQSRITGDWRFGSHNVQEVANLDAQSVQAGQLQLSGSAELNVANAQTLNVDHLHPRNIRLPSSTQGQACDPLVSSLALDSASGRLLTCDAANLSWKWP